MDRNAQHVVPQGEKWAVKAENAERASKVFDSKRKAIGYAYDIAAKNDSYLVIHSSTGEIEEFHATEETNKLIRMLLG